MKQGTRSRLTWCALGVVVATAVSLIVLRAARPIYYSDGTRAESAVGLRDASMLMWNRPEPEVELPGPVQGRVATLPGGRLIYGRVIDGKSDLVIFDPKRPGIEPARAAGLNSRGHDLAPAVGSDGTLYFASDREGGAGGFDIWSARVVGDAFVGLRPLGPAINTKADETDPAPHPASDRFVFVRRDPDVRGGRNGTLMVARLGATPAATALFAAEDGGTPPPLDRDPAFATDGTALWFVRQEAGGERQVLRSFDHGGRAPGWVEPIAVDRFSGEKLRSPLPGSDAFSVRLLDQKSSILYAARAYEVYPWWRGQREIEIVLLSMLGFGVLLLILLTLGGRWQQLDIITQCLLLSLLLHLLILLWMMRARIVHTVLPPPGPKEGTVSVRLLSAATASAAGRELRQENFDPSRDHEFAGFERDLEAKRPSAGADTVARRDARALEATRVQHTEQRVLEADAALADAAAAVSRRSGHDPTATLEAVAARAEQAESAPRAKSAAESQRQITVRVPRAVVSARTSAAASRRARLLANLPDRPRPEARQSRPAMSRLADAPRPKAPRALHPEPQHALAAVPGGIAVRQPPQPRRPRSTIDADRGDLARATPDGSAVGTVARRALAPSERHSVITPAVEPVAPSLTDAPAAAAPAKPSAEVSAALGPVVTRIAPRTVDAVQPEATLPRADFGGETSRPRPDRLARGGIKMRAVERSRELEPDTAAPSAVIDDRAEPAVAQQADPRPRRVAERELAPRGAVVPQQGTGLPVPVAPVRPGLAPARLRGGDDLRPLASGVPLAHVRGTVDAHRGARVAARSFDPGAAMHDRDATPVEPRAVTRTEPGARLEPRDVAFEGPVDRAGAGPVPPRPPVQRPLAAAVPPFARVERAARRRHDVATVGHARVEPARSLYANRFGERKAKALEKYGGTKATEHAVKLGLRYLARIQREDGSWGAARKWDRKYGEVHVGKTALCVLAFLGAGHTPSSDTRYSKRVHEAVEYLLSTQGRRTGHFGITSSYGHGISTYALAECYAMTKDRKLRKPLERAVAWILSQQKTRGPRHSRGGWGYFSPRLRAEDGYARASTTAWQVMALESARRSGIEVPDVALAMARRFLLQMFDEDHGYFLYNKEPDRLDSRYRTLPGSTPASTFCLLLLGIEGDDSRLGAALDYIVSRKPRTYRRVGDDEFVLRAQGNVYFWYYGSLACFFAGGEAWQKWNAALKKLLPSAQSPDGSFAPIDPYAGYAGDSSVDRAYTTAMCVLSLEVYYRYFTPMLRRR